MHHFDIAILSTSRKVLLFCIHNISQEHKLALSLRGPRVVIHNYHVIYMQCIVLYFVCQLYIFATVRLQNYFWGEVEEEEEGKWGCWSQFRGDNTVLETQFIFVILPCILQERRRRRSKKGWCDVPLPKCHSALKSEKNIA